MNLNALVHSSQFISNLQTNKYSIVRGKIVPVLKKISFVPAARQHKVLPVFVWCFVSMKRSLSLQF